MKQATAVLACLTLSACAVPVGPTPTNDLGPHSSQLANVTPQSPSSTPATRPTQDDKEWSFLVQPYVFFSSIEGDAGLGRVSAAPVDVDFSDILRTLELGAMIHTEAHHRSGWGVIVDYGFMDLSDDISGPIGLVTGADVRQGVLEGFISRRFETDDATVDVFGGVRWWDLDLDLGLTVGSGSRSRDVSWVDPVVGAKAVFPLGEGWEWTVRGDVGGFGIQSDFSWSAAGGILYHVSELLSVELQYKALGVDFDDGPRGTSGFFSYDTITHGPLLGFSFEF